MMINLDDLFHHELDQMADIFFNLHRYATLKASAIRHRKFGEIDKALNFERNADCIYDRLPKDFQW